MAENSAKWLDASYYQNIPSSEVNWAQLAQKWMQMRDTGQLPPASSGEQHPPPPSGKPPVASQPPDGLPVNGSFLPPGGYLPPAPVDGSYVGVSSGWLPPLPNSFGPPGGAFASFVPPLPPWMGAAPTPPGAFPSDASYSGVEKDGAEEKEEEGGEYSHYYKEWEEKQKRSQRENDSDDSETVPEGAMAHWLTPGPGWVPPSNWYRQSQRDSSGNAQMPFIDHQTRKVLPAWIREGLEKAEQERQKRLIKEAKLRAAEEAAKARRAAKGLGKFDSDSSEDENGNENTKDNGNLDGNPVFQRKKNEREFIEEEVGTDYRTDEEKREDALMLLRRFMTEVLLETTDNELDRIITEQFEIAKRSAQPKVLAQSSALAALSALGAESDDEESDEDEVQRKDDVASGMNEEVSQKPNTNDDVFSASLPVLSSGAKSKARLSSNDGLSSTESFQGTKKKEVVQESGDDNDDSSRVASTKNEDNSIFFEKKRVLEEKKPEKQGKDSSSNQRSKKSKKDKHISGESKKHLRKRSRSKEHIKKRRYHDGKDDLEKKNSGHTSDESISDRSESQTPERYRRRSRSVEPRYKRRSRTSRSRSRGKESQRFEGRRRSRSRERRRSRERHHRERRFRKSRS